MSKTLYYKNKVRQETEKIQKYVPNYQQMEIEPIKHKMTTVPFNHPQKTPEVLYDGGVPLNVGSVQSSWNEDCSEQLIDDISGLDPNAPMIDNNEFITDEATRQIGMSASNEKFRENTADIIIENNRLDLASTLQTLEPELYLLLLDGQAICSGPLNEIEEEVNALIFGEHELCQDKSFNENDILVLKKVKIKVGVFLEG